MTGIVLISAAQDDAQDEYTRSVELGYDPNELDRYFDGQTIRQVTDTDTGKVHVWRTSTFARWQSVQPGDIVMVYRDGGYMAQGRVVLTREHPGLASHLWRTRADDRDDGPGQYLVFLVGMEAVDLDLQEFNELIGYVESYVPSGFSRVAEHRIDTLEDRHGTVAAALESLTGRPVPPIDVPSDEAIRSTTHIRQPSSVLVLDSDTGSTEKVCTSLLSLTDPADTHLLSVTLNESPDARLSGWRQRHDSLPAVTGVVSIGDTTRSAATSPPTGPSTEPITIDTLATPSDITGLGMAISRYLEAWADTDATMVFCFHSITPLLIHTDMERVFRFLHVTISRLREVGAYAHFHLDAAAHPDNTAQLIGSLFDVNIRVDDDGSVNLSRTGRGFA